MESNFQKDMEESEKNFKAQFDPNSDQFHKGDKTVVPIGGNKIPNSMPSEYDSQKKLEITDY